MLFLSTLKNRIKYNNRTKRLKLKIFKKIDFDCDYSIYNGIKWLNDNGFYTMWCCSGVEEDHGGFETDGLYISFEILRSDKVCMIYDIAKELGFETKIEDFADIIHIGYNKENKIDVFNLFIDKMKNKIRDD